MLKKIASFKRHHKALVALIIGTSVISFWRGAWGLMDLYIFPGNPPLSFLVSAALGFGVLLITNYVVEELM